MQGILQQEWGPQPCKFCQAPITFDDRVLANSGNPLALNIDGTRHRCYPLPKDDMEWHLAAIRLVVEINKQLKGYKLKVVKEPAG